MSYRYTQHYTREEAGALLPQIRQWLQQVNRLRRELESCDRRLSGNRERGNDLGGELVNQWIKTIADVKAVLNEFQKREIQIKDVERGLVDFPALMGDKEVFLCWEQDEEDVEFWHELDAGYAGRERL